SMRAQCRREVNQVIDSDGLSSICGRLCRKWLRRRIPFALNLAFRSRPLLDGPYGRPADSIEDIKERLLAGQRNRFDRLTIDGDVGKNWCGRQIVIPYGMVHDLKVPLALTGFEIDADKTFAKQVVTRTVSA